MTWYRHLPKCSLPPERKPMNCSYRPVTYALERANLSLPRPDPFSARSSHRIEVTTPIFHTGGTLSNVIAQPSNGITTGESDSVAPPATESVTATPDPSESFYRLVRLTYDLFVAISGWMDFVNKSLQKQVTDLSLRNQAQNLTILAGPQLKPNKNEAWKDGDVFPFGGTATDGSGLDRANQLLDYLHSFDIATDVPEGYKSDQNAKLTDTSRNQITVQQFNGWQNSLKNQIEQIKNASQVDSTKADGIQKSANAALDLSTAFQKSIQTAQQSLAQLIR